MAEEPTPLEATMLDPALPSPSPSTVDRLLEGAATLFSDKGYAGTSTREISARVGIQSASLYYHVAGKEDLLYQLCISTLDAVAELFVAAGAGPGDALARLEQLACGYVELALNDRERHATMLIELRSLSASRRALVVERRDRNVALARALVVEAQEGGLLRADIPAKYLTLSLFNLLNWSIFWYRPDDELTPAEIARLLWSVFTQGVTGPPAGAPAGRPAGEGGGR